MLLMVDDVCEENIRELSFLDEIHARLNFVRAILFVVAKHKDQRTIAECREFVSWVERNGDWALVGVHGYDHMPPPEQERDDAEDLTRKATEILRPWLSSRPLYRAPGFQTTIRTEEILKKLGYGGIAHQTVIKWFGENLCTEGFINCHLTKNEHHNPVGRWREWLR